MTRQLDDEINNCKSQIVQCLKDQEALTAMMCELESKDKPATSHGEIRDFEARMNEVEKIRSSFLDALNEQSSTEMKRETELREMIVKITCERDDIAEEIRLTDAAVENIEKEVAGMMDRINSYKVRRSFFHLLNQLG